MVMFPYFNASKSAEDTEKQWQLFQEKSKMSETRIVTPNAPHNVEPLDPAAQRTMDSLVKWTVGNAANEREKAIREKAVRAFADFLATTASPKGTVQREKLQGFATEFLESKDSHV